DRMFSEPFRQEIDVAHAIEHRKNHRLWSNGRGKIVHRRLQRIGFYAEKDELVRCADLLSADEFRSKDRITMRADDAKTILSELFLPRWTNEEGHVAPGLGQPATKVTTHRTGADDKHPHGGEVLS